jgi:hypothetical protein
MTERDNIALNRERIAAKTAELRHRLTTNRQRALHRFDQIEASIERSRELLPPAEQHAFDYIRIFRQRYLNLTDVYDQALLGGLENILRQSDPVQHEVNRAFGAMGDAKS